MTDIRTAVAGRILRTLRLHELAVAGAHNFAERVPAAAGNAGIVFYTIGSLFVRAHAQQQEEDKKRGR